MRSGNKIDIIQRLNSICQYLNLLGHPEALTLPHNQQTMARTKKYPLWPGPGEKEVPYDTGHFIMWCVNVEGMTQGSAKMYVHRIQKAFEVVFDSQHGLFDLLSDAFAGYWLYPDLALKNLECASSILGTLISHMRKISPEEFFKENGLDYKPKTLAEWVSAFSAYHRYYEYRIDKLRARLSIPQKNGKSRREALLPLKKEFTEYLLSECNYPADTASSYISSLTKINNHCINDGDEVNGEDIFTMISQCTESWDEVSIEFDGLFEELYGLVKVELDLAKIFKANNEPCPVSVSDVSRGQTALHKYHDFLRSRFKNQKCQK